MTWREYRCAEVTRMCQAAIDSGYIKRRLEKYLAIPKSGRKTHVSEQPVATKRDDYGLKSI